MQQFMRFLRTFTMALVVGTAIGATARSEDKPSSAQTFTQVPTVAASTVRGQTLPAESAPNAADQAKLQEGPTPQWIWGENSDRNYVLRVEFEGGAQFALLKAACDNVMSIWVNDVKVAEGDNWNEAVAANVRPHLRPGRNVLTAEVNNQGGAAGFILKLALIQRNGATRYVVTDKSWKVAERRDATDWVAAKEVGPLGVKPWGNVFSKTATSAEPRDVFLTLPGFQVERLFTVPKEQLGSWVSITFDNQGRLIASDQDKQGLCRITLPPIGSQEPTKVERLTVPITAAQGMLYAFDSLYLSVNGGPGSGFYRARDTDNDDQFDEVVKLAPFRGGGEHGPHALRLTPDGRSILVICGNHTDPPETIDASRVPQNWDEDHLLPRQWDAGGHAVGRMAPGGWIAKTDPEGKTWEILSIGYRNTYDMDLNADGEIFAYDADMEWDFGMPWYRPTRLVHSTLGSEFGWRSGTGKWPAYYIDSLPPVVDIGPGSPVGVSFGYGAKFPQRYQKALYLLDWTFGTIYAVHLEPNGSTYQGVKEEFLSRTPLPLTDVAVGPDGALYFTVGGRGTQSELYRVTYTGPDPTDRVDAHDEKFADARALRRKLEALCVPNQPTEAALAAIWPNLSHADRFIRYTARVALEFQPVSAWQEKVLQEKNSQALIAGAVALARQGDKALQPKLLDALDRLDFGQLQEAQQLDLLRAWSLVFIRMGEPEASRGAELAAKLDAYFPASSDFVNRELCALLVYLKSPTVSAKTIALMKQPRELPPAQVSELLARNPGYGNTIAEMIANQPDAQKLHYLFVLRNLKEGWNLEDRKYYFQWFQEARSKKGGASYQGFLNNIDRDAFDNCSEVERLAVEAAGLRKPFQIREFPKPQGPGHNWTVAEINAFTATPLSGRNFENGKKMFAAARCVVCHRFAGDGGATGPDLTQAAGRFSFKDLTESLLEPSKVVSDQYKASTVVTLSGKTYTGRILNETKNGFVILTDPEDSTKIVEVAKDDIDELRPSPVSLMPKDLLNPMNENEVLDLFAYLLSRGNPKDPVFKR